MIEGYGSIYVWLMDPDPDPDPGGPKTYGSGGSGSLLVLRKNSDFFIVENCDFAKLFWVFSKIL
jgi:hypothetical protein